MASKKKSTKKAPAKRQTKAEPTVRETEPATMGRPKKGPLTEKDFDNLETLLKIQCTLAEVAMFFDCDQKTIETRVKEHYKVTFSELSTQKREFGKISIRRRQYKKGVIDGNVTMLIWLGKQYCGQRDKIDQNHQGGGLGSTGFEDLTDEQVKARLDKEMQRREARNDRRSRSAAPGS